MICGDSCLKFFVWFGLALSIGGCTSIHKTNPTPEEYNAQKSPDAEFEKEAAAKKAYNIGYEEGVRAGYTKAISAITDGYLPYIKRLEAGKYLSKKELITPPELVAVRGSDDTISYKVTGCKVERELNIYEILAKFGAKSMIKQESDAKATVTDSEAKDASQSIGIPERDRPVYLVSKPKDFAYETIQKIAKSAKIKSILDRFSMNYTDKDGYYFVKFTNIEEQDGFCKQFDVCEGSK